MFLNKFIEKKNKEKFLFKNKFVALYYINEKLKERV